MKKTTIRKITAALLCFLLLLSAPLGTNLPGGFPLTASAAGYSGTCGENLTWTLNTTTGILAISGTGAMWDYSSSSNAPWYSNRSSIREVQIANGVTSIGDWAFRGCTSLTSVTIGDSVTSIGGYAFVNCTSLTSVTIPDSVTSIGDDAFSGCTSLTSITVKEGNPKYSSDEYGVLLNKDKTLLIQYPVGNTRTSYTIPDSVTSIGWAAFLHCTSLTSVTIPDSVTCIGDWAFLHCTSLTSVTIPDSVTCIGKYAFYECTSLTSVTIPDSVTSIGDWAFGDCTSLTSVTIPDSVTSIDYGAFKDCTSLTSITIPDSVTSIGDAAFYNTGIYNNASNWENDVLYIGNHLIKAITSITGDYLVKSGTKTIADDAFCDCTRLTSVTIPDSVTSIGDAAFWDCTRLTSVTIPNGVTSIGADAFAYCSSLNYVHIPASVTSIGESILDESPAYICSDTETCYAKEYAEANGIEFRVCKHSNSIISGTCGENLTWTLDTGILTITGTGEMEDYDSYLLAPWYSNRSSIREVQIANGVTSIGNSAFWYCTSLTGVTIGDSVTSIDYSAFRNCTSLTSVTIPDSVTSIGSYAFYDCTGLTSVTIPDSVTSIGDSAFSHCTSLTSITVKEGNPKYSSDEYGVLLNKDKTLLIQYPIGNTRTSYTIPDSVTSIGWRAFEDCTSLTSVTIPDSVTSIGYSAFEDCTSLTSVTIPDSVTSIGSPAFDNTGIYNNASNWENDVLYIGNHLIEAKTSITGDYLVKPGTKTIADYAFWDCTSLTSVTIPDSVTSIGWQAFSGCTSLTSVTIGDSVTSIGDSAFSHCTSLISVTIPNSVTSIGWWAFADCSSLNYVHISDSVTTIRGSILYNSPAYICSDTAECYAKEYAEANSIEFRVCDGHSAAEPEPPKFDGTTGTVQADCTPGCFDVDAHLVVSESDKTLPEFGITVSGYVQVQKTYNIQVQNAHGQPLQPKSGHTVTLRLPLPLDDHGNPYDAGKYSVYHLIDNDPANTESFRAKKGNLKIENGFLVIEVSHFSPFVVVVESEMPTVSIAGNPGTFTLRYKETLVLHAEAENLPDGASLLWEADKDGIVELKPSGDGTTCEVISKKTGDVRITVKVVDADGSEIEGSGSDTETVQSKAGFFQKLLAFFRLLFGIKVRIDQRKK